MQFVHQALTWGFLLALVPVLIHLINMMRHQRVRWAAMDFLLQSYKKHRKWVWLKQLVLLLARMAAIALLVAMLAQWVTQRQWFNLFGGTATHHYILVDDSYSMSERAGGATAFDLARQVLNGIAQRAAESDVAQRFTLVRFSQAARVAAELSGEGDAAGDAVTRLALAADFNAEPVDSSFITRLEDKHATLEPTQLAVGPQPALELVRQLLSQGGQENALVYLVTDFRAGQWDQPAASRELLLEMQRGGATIELVQCSQAAQPNLAVTDIQPLDETRAANVPLFVNVTVKNFGSAPVRKVPLKIRTIYTPPDMVIAGEVERAWENVYDFPAPELAELGPGASITTRVQVSFPRPGMHVVEAELPDDAVLADNRRWCVIDFPEGEPVLLVDGTPEQRHAYYLGIAFQPGERARTGVLPVTKPAAYLRDADPRELATYRAIYLLDLDRLDDIAVRNLEQYVSAGGGLAIFVGPNTNLRFYTDRLYRNGEGLLPLPLEREDALRPPVEEGEPDFQVFDHPLFVPFQGERNSLVRLVNIDRYLRPPTTWKPPAGSTVVVAAQLRDRAPLAVERRFGDGRVVVFLTTLAPDWNNWAPNPSFVVLALRLQSYLVAHQASDAPHVVGQPLSMELDARRYTDALRWVIPGARRGTRVPLERQATRESADRLETALGALGTSGVADSTGRAGVYEVWPRTTSGAYELRRFAVNVEPEEGDMTLLDSQTLLSRLAPLKAEYQLATQFQAAGDEHGGVNRSLLLMALLIVLLLGEQFLAYVLSYHPAPVAALAGRGQRWQRGPVPASESSSSAASS